MAHMQGTMTQEKRETIQGLRQKVLPSTTKLWNGEDSEASMRDLADGYFAMKEYEYALYAYKYLLFRPKFQRFDSDIIDRIHVCLEELGMGSLKGFLGEWLAFLGDAFFTVAPYGEKARC
jgi:hypothetical protein